jgi:diguanylate cyclase
MNKVVCDALNHVSEGIVVLDEETKILAWNRCMEAMTGIREDKALNNILYDVIPGLNVSYFSRTVSNVARTGCKMFFSAAMHKGLVTGRENLNIKINRFENSGAKFLLVEFIDVTDQFVQMERLKNYVRELCDVNKQLKEKEKIIKNLAYYDNLTGIANRTLFYELAEKFLRGAKRNNSMLGLIFIDIDKFKSINDTYGHKAGDEVLVKVTEILKEATRTSDIVARHGGDEFLILLPHIKHYNDCEIIISKIINNKNNTVGHDGQKIKISMSMGISSYPANEDTIDKLIAEADKAMYAVKNRKALTAEK